MLKRLCAWALSLFLAVQPSQAGINNPGSGSSSQAGLQTSVLDVSGVGNALAFINFLKSVGANGAPPGFDTDGYPTVVPSATKGLGSINLPSTYSGNWVYQHAGTGCIRLDRGSPGYTVVSGGAFVVGSTVNNLLVQGTNARVVFSFTTSAATSISVNWPSVAAGCTGGYSGMSNAYLVRADQEAAFLAGELFNPDFLATINGSSAALNPGIIRLLDWAAINQSNSASFTNRRQISALAWNPSATVYDTTLNGGAISGTDTYAIGPSPTTPGGYVNGETIQGIFANTNTVTGPTLNINGKGAKTIRGLSGVTIAIGEIPINQVETLVYDSTLDVLLYNNQNTFSGTGLILGVPYEAQIALCNKLAKPCWLQIPHLWAVADASALVSLAAASLNKPLYLEYSNEFWNTGFVQTNWGNRVATVNGFTTGAYHSEYGLKFCQIMPAAISAWGATRSASDLIGVNAFQAFGATSLVNTYRFLGNELGAFGCNVAPNRPIDFTGAMSYAHYYSGAQIQNFNVCNPLSAAAQTAATDYASGVPAQMASALDFMSNDARSGTCNAVLWDQSLLGLSGVIYPKWETLANTYSKPVIAYEGGYEVGKPTVAQLNTAGVVGATYAPLFATLIDAFKNDVRFKQLVTDQYTQFIAQPHSKRPAWYNFGPGASQWSLYPGSIENTPFQSYNAISDYNTAH